MASDLCAIAPADWKIQSIADVCQRITSGGTPSRREPAYYEGGVWPWVKTQELQDGWIDDTEEHITKDAITASSAKILPANTVLLAMYGATVGQLGILRRSMTCNQACCALIADPDKADFRFLYFQLLQIRSELRNLATGAAQQNLSGAVIKTLRLPFPPIEEQRAIAHILGTLDDKIELNRKQNETLEAMARALFKAWFVDFEPVRAKMEGRWQRGQSLPGLPQHLYDLFPSRLVDSELGEIPEGWGVTSVDVEFDVTMGQSPPGYTYNETGEGLPFYQGRADFEFRFPKRRVYCTAPTRLAKNGDTLVSVRAPVGDINMASEDCAIGRGVAAVRHKTGCRSYTYQFMSSISDVFARFDAEGTVFGSIGKKDFHSIAHVRPPGDLVLAYEKFAAQPDDQIERSEHESRSLAQLRDTLLPKLISGELRVPDAERILGTAI
ncbi:MAG: restriction endonuclease subunit S [Pirellulales bacterium]